MNVISFPTPTFSLLNGLNDGFWVLFSFGSVPLEAHVPFHTVAEARAWAAATRVAERPA